MIILGIETSCDETALALIETRECNDGVECCVVQSLVHSQAELHNAYGGVYPSLAKREHGKNLIPLLHKLLSESAEFLNTESEKKSETINTETYNKIIESYKTEISGQNPELFESFKDAQFIKKIPQIDRIAVTEGPGLEPALWVGINFSRILSTIWSIPLYPINHMEGHIFGSLLNSDKPYGSWQKLNKVLFPSIALLISGGHTELVEIKKGEGSELKYNILGQTKDDAVGEAYDKVARLLGLPYPGGPHISMLSEQAKQQGLASPIKLPRPMIRSGNLDFSFSGLKTAVLYAVRANSDKDGKLDEKFKKELAREFEEAVTETLESKLKQAIDKIDAKSVIIGGGVSANKMLRERFNIIANEYNIPIYMPSKHISGDNALMIALAGSFKKHEKQNPLKAKGTLKL